jgi:hypothetical protein
MVGQVTLEINHMATGGARLRGVDGRSSRARRHRQLLKEFARDLGGEAALTTAERCLIAQAAVTVVTAEELQASLLSGESIEHDRLVRINNSVTRLLTALGVQRRKRQAPHVPVWLKGKADEEV